jgi:hypothetical protein
MHLLILSFIFLAISLLYASIKNSIFSTFFGILSIFNLINYWGFKILEQIK